MQPALAFVGGLSFELMPAPLAEMDTTVCCWALAKELGFPYSGNLN